MPTRVRAFVVALCLCAGGALAQTPPISIQVTRAESRFDLKAVDPFGTAYAMNLGRSSTEVWASTDNARTWSLRGALPGSIKVMTALSDGTVLANYQSGTNFFLARSGDRGATWRTVLALGQYRLLTPHSIDELGGTAYLAEYQSFTASAVPVRLWVSTDRGATWSVRRTFEGHRHAHAIRAAPDGSLWLFFGDDDSQAGAFRSTDGGFNWSLVLAGQEARINDVVFVGNDALFGQDIPAGPLRNHAARLTPSGQLTKIAAMPGPSYSIRRAPGGGFLVGITREPTGDVYAPGDVSAHLMGSADGVTWSELGNYPRIDASDYARADVYWALPSGEVVLNLRHVQALPGGRGYQLLRVSLGTAPLPTSFTDDFDACTSEVDLGARWSTSGRWYCRVGRARGETAGGLALARTSAFGDTDVSALVQLNNATGSGVVARAEGGHYYAARILPGSLEIVRVNGASTAVLARAPAAILDGTSCNVRLRVTGSGTVQLEALVNGASVARATDPSTSRLASGSAGLLTGRSVTGAFFRSQYDDFSVTGSTTTTPPPPPPPGGFADNFDACTSTTDLGANWSVSGRWYCQVGRARGETGGGLALVKATLPNDQLVQSLVQLNGAAGGSGTVARAAAGHFYAARIFSNRLEIVRIDNGATTVLGSVARSFLVNNSYVLALRVTGSTTVQLVASVNGAAALSATDSTANRLTSGSAGLLSGVELSGVFARTQYDHFSVASP